MNHISKNILYSILKKNRVLFYAPALVFLITVFEIMLHNIVYPGSDNSKSYEVWTYFILIFSVVVAFCQIAFSGKDYWHPVLMFFRFFFITRFLGSFVFIFALNFSRFISNAMEQHNGIIVLMFLVSVVFLLFQSISLNKMIGKELD